MEEKPESQYRIAWPPGENYVSMSILPLWIANAIYEPKPSSLRRVTGLFKSAVIGERASHRIEDLSDGDEEIVDRLCGASAISFAAIDMETAFFLQTKFNTHPDRPAWELGLTISDGEYERAILRNMTANDWREYLRQKVENGHLQLRKPGSFVPIPWQHSIPFGELVVDREEATRFLATEGVRVVDKASKSDRYVFQDIEKTAAGRYTLKEAADAICQGSGERFKNIFKKLVDAAKNGELPVYRPGEKARHEYREVRDGGQKMRPDIQAAYDRSSIEEAYWNDLNDWLDNNESRINFRFSEAEQYPLTVSPSEELPSTPLASGITGGNSPIKKKRMDALGSEIAEICSSIGPNVDSTALLAAFRSRIGNRVIISVSGSTVTWRDRSGTEKSADTANLRDRLRRLHGSRRETSALSARQARD